jgi:hypothetical protein
VRHVYLEDSWVLDVYPSAQMFAFELDAVLTPTHPATGALRRASSTTTAVRGSCSAALSTAHSPALRRL